jgi:PP-loop superfamily ATP-utilizing enzyme
MSKQSIYNILAAKAEPVKVEFSIVNEIRQELENDSAAKDALTKVFEAEDLYEKSLQNQKQIMAKIEKGIQIAKELGVDSVIKDLEKYRNYSKENMQYIQSSINKLSQIGE